jgi:hypothetical protein
MKSIFKTLTIIGFVSFALAGSKKKHKNAPSRPNESSRRDKSAPRDSPKPKENALSDLPKPDENTLSRPSNSPKPNENAPSRLSNPPKPDTIINRINNEIEKLTLEALRECNHIQSPNQRSARVNQIIQQRMKPKMERFGIQQLNLKEAMLLVQTIIQEIPNIIARSQSQEEFSSELDAEKIAICDEIAQKYDVSMEAFEGLMANIGRPGFEADEKFERQLQETAESLAVNSQLFEESVIEWTIKEQNACSARFMTTVSKLMNSFQELMQRISA